MTVREAEAPADGDGITLAGRRFRAVSSLTVAQRSYWDRQFRRAKATRTPDTPEEYVEAVDLLTDAGVMPNLVATFLVEDRPNSAWVKRTLKDEVDVPASFAAADAVAGHLWTLAEEIDVALYAVLLREILTRFFPKPADAPAPSPASTNADPAPPATGVDAESASGSAGASTAPTTPIPTTSSGSGTPSPDASPAGITTS